jgi:hypothetical protein
MNERTLGNPPLPCDVLCQSAVARRTAAVVKCTIAVMILLAAALAGCATEQPQVAETIAPTAIIQIPAPQTLDQARLAAQCLDNVRACFDKARVCDPSALTTEDAIRVAASKLKTKRVASVPRLPTPPNTETLFGPAQPKSARPRRRHRPKPRPQRQSQRHQRPSQPSNCRTAHQSLAS